MVRQPRPLLPQSGRALVEHEGITRCVVDGLMIGWSKTPSRKQLNVEVWQIYISGKKPGELAGSQDDKIIVK